MERERATVLAAFAEIVNTISTAPGVGEFIEFPTLHTYALGMYANAVSLCRAVQVLLSHGLDNAALTVARSLFEESLRLHELGEADEGTRAKLLIGWAVDSLQRDEGRILDAKREGIGLADSDRLLRQIDSERKKMEGYATRNGIIGSQKFMSAWTAAKTLSREGGAWAADVASLFVHGNLASQRQRSSAPAQGEIAISTSSTDPRMAAVIAGYAAVSLIYAYAAAQTLFDWDPLNEIDELMTLAEGLAD